MESIIKNNRTVTRLELEQLYFIYADNLIEGVEKKEMNSWIDEIIQEPNIFYSMLYDNDKLAGYMIIYLREKENYIREFEIAKEYQNNGVTFKELIKETLPYTDSDKIYTGRILGHNEEAKGVFRRIGAIVVDGKYQVTYDRLMKMIDLNSKEDFVKKEPNPEVTRRLLSGKKK